MSRLPVSSVSRTRGDIVPVWRDATTLQVGLDDDVLVLSPVPPLADELVLALVRDGRLPDAEGSDDTAWHEWIADQLSQHGRLGPAATSATVRLIGSGRVAAQLACLLVDAGQQVRICDRTPAPDGSGTAGERLVRDLRRTRRGRTVVADRGELAALTVVCTSTCEPDRSVTDALTRDGTPYLVVRTRPGKAVVGPLVVPATTSCVRCTDLWRADADPVWPRLAAQLALRPSPYDPVLDAWATATAVTQVVAWLRGQDGELRSRTLTLDAESGRTSLRVWPVHPACRCRTLAHDLGGSAEPDRIGA